MTFGWPNLWPYARTGWGWTVAIVSIFSILFTIYHGPKVLWETYDWYMDRLFDHKVKEFMESTITRSSASGTERAWAIPKSITEIAKATGLSEKRALGCLRRLKRKGAVSREHELWKPVFRSN
jgi:hypothetical protein